MSSVSSSSSGSALSSRLSTPSSSRSRDSSLTPFEPPQQLLDEYQSLLSSTFDLTGLLPTQPPDDGDNEEGGKIVTKAEKQNAKKKRRKERERQAKLEEAGGGPSRAEADTSASIGMSSPQCFISSEADKVC